MDDAGIARGHEGGHRLRHHVGACRGAQATGAAACELFAGVRRLCQLGAARPRGGWWARQRHSQAPQSQHAAAAAAAAANPAGATALVLTGEVHIDDGAPVRKRCLWLERHVWVCNGCAVDQHVNMLRMEAGWGVGLGIGRVGLGTAGASDAAVEALGP